jgi:RNA polymerase sigma-70 factor (ECF subfamily)
MQRRQGPKSVAWQLFLLELCRMLCVIGAISWARAGLGEADPDQGDEPTDEELMVRYVAGDERAFNVLMRRYQGKMYGYIYRHYYNPDRASEVFQDCWYKVVRAADSYDPTRSFATWLFTIVRNTMIDTFKKKKLKMRSLDAPLRSGEEKRKFADVVADTHAVDAEQIARKRQLEGRLKEALDGLNPDQRDVFEMRHFQGLQFVEIAEIMDCPVNTAKTRMRYALEALRRELQDFLV